MIKLFHSVILVVRSSEISISGFSVTGFLFMLLEIPQFGMVDLCPTQSEIVYPVVFPTYFYLVCVETNGWFFY